MQLVNYMEEAVKRGLDELLKEPAYQSLRLDEKAKLDVMAFALNHLPPKYVVTEKGHLFTRVEELRQQFKTDIVVELSKAIQLVKENPR
jgi:competence protein ComFB